MGNSGSKSDISLGVNLNKHDQTLLKSNFKLLSKNSDKIILDDLKKNWNTMDPYLYKSIEKFLFSINPNASSIDYINFLKMSAMSVRGTVEDKSKFAFESIKSANGNHIEYLSLHKFVESVIKTYFKVLVVEKCSKINSWISKGYSTDTKNIEIFAEYLSHDIEMDKSNLISSENLEKWLQKSSTFLIIFEHIFYHFLFKSNMKPEIKNVGAFQYLPLCNSGELKVKEPHIDISQILFINSNLPRDLRTEWRCLFSTATHGESFSTLIGKILNQGPTVLILKDENNDMFGGFAPASWSISPQFYGDDTSFLFTLKSKMHCFPITGYNDHYQYLNLHQQTMPNGLGLGGQFDYWGLWINSEFGLGECSETCTTFQGYTQLSQNKKFKISHLEVWGIGELKKDEEDGDDQGRSVLDNAEDRAYLEIAGKTLNSDGYRDTNLDDPDFGK